MREEQKTEEFTYEVIEHLASVSDEDAKYEVQLNAISFKGKPPRLDIRRWRNGKMYKGISLSREEARRLARALEEAADRDDLPVE